VIQGVGSPTGKTTVQLTGKPLAQAKGQLVQLGGKGQQTLGLIQTPQGTINIIPQAVTGTTLAVCFGSFPYFSLNAMLKSIDLLST